MSYFSIILLALKPTQKMSELLELLYSDDQSKLWSETFEFKRKIDINDK